MSEGRPLDPVAVREARKRLEFWLTLEALTPSDRAARDALILVLAALDEGREASAPFATVPPAWVSDDEEVSRWLKAKVLRRLAAFHEAVSEPEGKNDG